MFKERLLNQEDVAGVVSVILDVAVKSDKFGRLLKLPKATVDSIHQQYNDPKDRLFGVIDEFVKRMEPPPTWRVILEALRDPLIDHPRLASEIEAKYSPATREGNG